MRHQGPEQREPPRYPVRWGAPDDVVDAVGYLVSEDAGFVTGQRLVVNGGPPLLLNMFGPAP
jgi:NAD(P)-dependent dehydrogenase (short-subunit alcohol dehydrogenase family)